MFPIITHTTNPYAYTLSHLKIAFSRKAFYFSIHWTRQIYQLLMLLRKLNIIRRVVLLKNTKCRIYPTYTKTLLPPVGLKNFYRLKNPIYLTYKSLQLIATSALKSVLVIETSYGVITHEEALKLKSGGILITIIN